MMDDNCLEVGTNDQGEVVINHPRLDVDEKGCDHLVFSPEQARNLANILHRQACEAERINLQKARERAAAIPVNREDTTLSNGGPVTPDHKDIDPATGMQKGYVVLSAAERAKGFVRPVRRSYRHVGARPEYETRDLTPEEQERYKDFGYVKYETYPKVREDHSSVVGRFWTAAQLHSGCGTVTTMAPSIAETYARDPGFYSGGYCVYCRAHFSNDEFVWDGTDERVGS